ARGSTPFMARISLGDGEAGSAGGVSAVRVRGGRNGSRACARQRGQARTARGEGGHAGIGRAPGSGRSDILTIQGGVELQRVAICGKADRRVGGSDGQDVGGGAHGKRGGAGNAAVGGCNGSSARGDALGQAGAGYGGDGGGRRAPSQIVEGGIRAVVINPSSGELQRGTNVDRRVLRGHGDGSQGWANEKAAAGDARQRDQHGKRQQRQHRWFRHQPRLPAQVGYEL